MSILLKTFIGIWLFICGFTAWVGLAMVAVLAVFPNYNWIYPITPIIGLTVWAALFYAFKQIMKANL